MTWRDEPRVVAYRQAYAALDPCRVNREAYTAACIGYVQAVGEQVEDINRRPMILGLFKGGIPIEAIREGLRATDDEMSVLEPRPAVDVSWPESA